MNTDNLYKMLTGSQRDHADLFVAEKKSLYVITSSRGKSGFYYDGTSRLWSEISDSRLVNDISRFLSSKCEEVLTELSKTPTEENYRKTSDLHKLNKKFGRATHMMGIIPFVLSSIVDKNFMGSLNSSKNILPIRGGKVIDLKTKTTRDRVADDRFTYELNVEYKVDQPNAKRFFAELMTEIDLPEKKREVTKYLQTCLGYSITGEIDQKCFFVLLGSGDNGKSKLLEALSTIFNEFYSTVERSVVFNIAGRDNMPFIAKLAGKRIGALNEPDACMTIRESDVKALVGNGDKVTAKALYKDPFDFTPIVKIFILTNKEVKIDTTSKAILKRLHFINMKATFKDKALKPDRKKFEYVADEAFASGMKDVYSDEVFSWIVDGSFKYYKQGKIVKPQQIIDEQDKYISKIDPYNDFIGSKCIKKDNYKVKRNILFEAFIDYCKDTSQDCKGITMQKFYEAMRNIGFKDYKTSEARYFTGLKVKDNLDMTDDTDSDSVNTDTDSDSEVVEEKPIKKQKSIVSAFKDRISTKDKFTYVPNLEGKIKQQKEDKRSMKKLMKTNILLQNRIRFD